MSIFRRFLSNLVQARHWAARTFLRPANVLVFSLSAADPALTELAEQTRDGR